MKKAGSILYLCLLVFNLCGYLLLVQYLQQKEQNRLQQIIEDRGYDSAQLLELSVALHLPYTSDWHEWEHVEGMVTVDGIPYQYVERKLQQGRMYYRCLPNTGVHNALSARDRFIQLSYDLTHASGKPSGGNALTIKPPVFDLICMELMTPCHPFLQAKQALTNWETVMPLPALSLTVPTPPPNMV